MITELYISSRNNPLLQKYAKLTDKKYRESERLFLLEGEKLFEEAVLSGAEIESVLLLDGKKGEIAARTLTRMAALPTYAKTRIFRLSESAFSKISTEKSPDGVIGAVKYLDNFRFFNKIEENDLAACRDEKILLLYSLRDPGNVGTIARSAAAFGFDRLIVSADTADPYGSRAMRASMGAFFKLRMDFVSDFASVIRALRASGRNVYCAELRPGAVSVDSLSVSQTDCFVIGNEGHGVAPEISALCTASAYIPIAPGSESLNAAIAGSILAFLQR